LGTPTTEEELLARFRVAWREIQRGRAIRGIEARARRNHDELDLRQTDVLEVVIATGGCRMSDLSELLAMNASNATRTVVRLADNGYVTRSAVPDDGRAVMVRPTKAGIKVWNEVNDRRAEAVVYALSRFPKAQRTTVVEILETMGALLSDFIESVDD
jgi:DNA-binding MarR family transcriptional regulator